VTLSGPAFPQRSLHSGDLAAALDWWREAGVDCDYHDAARDWLEAAAPAVTAPPEPAQPPAALPKTKPVSEPAAKIGGAPQDWPQELGDFAAWWLSEPSLDNGQIFGRIAPRGSIGARIMVLIEHPEAEDSQSLLSGPEGRLIEAILMSIGISPDQAYFASALPRHMPMPDWPALHAAGLGELTRHHVALAAPQRVIGFGANVSSLLGHDPAKSTEPFRQFYHVGATIPALAAPGLNSLMARPKAKAGLWASLLDWQQG